MLHKPLYCVIKIVQNLFGGAEGLDAVKRRISVRSDQTAIEQLESLSFAVKSAVDAWLLTQTKKNERAVVRTWREASRFAGSMSDDEARQHERRFRTACDRAVERVSRLPVEVREVHRVVPYIPKVAELSSAKHFTGLHAPRSPQSRRRRSRQMRQVASC